MARVIPFPPKPVLALVQGPQRRNLETRRFQLVRRVARVLALVHNRPRRAMEASQ